MGLFEDLSKFNRRQEAVVTAFSKIGYKVVPRKGTPCINRDNKTVYLPVVDPAKYPDVLRTIRGWTDHEMAHELYKSDMGLLKKAIGQGKKFEAIFRYLEDGRVERLESEAFEGCRENLLYGEREALAERKKMGLTLYLAGKYGASGVKLYKMEEWGAIIGADLVKKCYNIQTCQQAYDVAQEAYGRIQKYIDKAVTGEMESEKSEEESEPHPTVSKEGPEEKEEKKGKPKEQDEILQDDKPEPKKSKGDKKDEADSEKSEETSKTEDSSESDDGPEDDETGPGISDEPSDGSKESGINTESEASDDNNEDSDSDESESDSDGDDSEDSDSVVDEADEGDDSTEPGAKGTTPEEDAIEKASRMKSKLDDMISDKDLMDDLLKKLHKDLEKIPEDPRSYTPYTENDVVYDLTKGCSSFTDKGWFPRLIDEARTKVNVLAQKLRLELFATKMLNERYKDRGRLDQRRLHVLGMGTTTDVFMKRTIQPEIDTAISLLIDSSLSMGSSIKLAAQVAYLLSSTLETINIPHEVLSFTACGDRIYGGGYDRTLPLRHFIHKSFSTRLNHCLEAMNRIGSIMSQNTDGESVLWAAARLATRKEKRRVLFVLSDGEPVNGETNEYKLSEHLKEIIRLVSKHGIECVGIGIQTDCVEKFYPHSVVVNNLNDLVTTAYGELVQAIRGAKREVR